MYSSGYYPGFSGGGTGWHAKNGLDHAVETSWPRYVYAVSSDLVSIIHPGISTRRQDMHQEEWQARTKKDEMLIVL